MMNNEDKQRLTDIARRIKEIEELLPDNEVQVLQLGVTPAGQNLNAMREEKKLRDELAALYKERTGILIENKPNSQ